MGVETISQRGLGIFAFSSRNVLWARDWTERTNQTTQGYYGKTLDPITVTWHCNPCPNFIHSMPKSYTTYTTLLTFCSHFCISLSCLKLCVIYTAKSITILSLYFTKLKLVHWGVFQEDDSLWIHWYKTLRLAGKEHHNIVPDELKILRVIDGDYLWKMWERCRCNWACVEK